MTTAPVPPSDAAPEGTGADQWSEAVDRYRDVAKWLVVAFGAVGAVIAGTAPLAGIGDIAPGRLAYVIAGGAIALAGVAGVFASTASVLVPRAVFAYQLRARREGPIRQTFFGLGRLESGLADHPGDFLPDGISDPDSLRSAIANLRLAAIRTAANAAAQSQSPESRARNERAHQAVSGTLRSHERALDGLLRVARFERARTQFNRGIVVVVLGGMAAATGLALTLYGIGGKVEPKPVPKPALSEPVPVVVSMTPLGIETLGSRLGGGCDLHRVESLLIAGERTAGPWDLVVLPVSGCQPIRFTLTAELGTLG